MMQGLTLEELRREISKRREELTWREAEMEEMQLALYIRYKYPKGRCTIEFGAETETGEGQRPYIRATISLEEAKQFEEAVYSLAQKRWGDMLALRAELKELEQAAREMEDAANRSN